MTATADPGVARDAPRSASSRRYLRDSLPGVYREAPLDAEPFVVTFVGGLERLLDPIVTLLDNLGAHFDARLAPEAVVDGLAAALGVREAEGLPPAARRRLVLAAIEIAAHRGTRAGLERVLRLAFDLDADVEETGGVTWGGDPRGVPAAEPPRFRVRCDPHPIGDQARRIDRIALLQRPIHVAYEPIAGPAGPR